jgi:hypothetical protein
VVSPAKPAIVAELTTPSARNKVASRLLIDRAATPPLRGGEYCSSKHGLGAGRRGEVNHFGPHLLTGSQIRPVARNDHVTVTQSGFHL